MEEIVAMVAGSEDQKISILGSVLDFEIIQKLKLAKGEKQQHEE